MLVEVCDIIQGKVAGVEWVEGKGAGCEVDVDWAGCVGAGAVLIGWGSGTAGCVLGGPEEGKKEKLVGGL